VSDGVNEMGKIPSVMKRYERAYVSMPLGKAQLVAGWSAPSLKEVFNTAYLTTALKHADPLVGIRKLFS
jgi:hypothetical protein